jgi:SAM-dependent methyltransferase
MATDPPAEGSDLYDDAAVFDRYFDPREPSESPVFTMESPAFWEVVGDVAGLEILDLGCGDGGLGGELLARGASTYTGVDGSLRMIDAASDRLGSAAALVHDNLDGYAPPTAAFDLVVSLRALHYVRDLTAVLSRAAGGLRPGGRLVYSHEHPVITSYEAREPDGRRTDWRVDNYFVPGERDVVFLGRKVRKYHRTVEEHLDAVANAGLQFVRLSECAPRWHRFDGDRDEYERRRRIPLFLLIEATRPSVRAE